MAEEEAGTAAAAEGTVSDPLCPYWVYSAVPVLLRRLLEMLIVLAGVPVAAPGKSVFLKQAAAQVVFVDFIRERFAAVRVFFSGGRGHIDTVVPVVRDIRIVQGIDVDGQPVGVS